MKAPKMNKATMRANEHPQKLVKGGDVEGTGTFVAPKGFDPQKMVHYLAKGEKPLTADELIKLGYKLNPTGSENEYITPNGDYVHYKPVTPGTTGYNVADNPYYEVPQMPVTASTDKPFKPKYLPVSKKGTPEWEANQAAIEAEKNKRAGTPTGFKYGGGIQKLLAGGDIRSEDLLNIPQGERQYSNKAKDYIKDTGLAAADFGLGGLGMGDVIQADNYKTKAGVKANRMNAGVQAVGEVVGGAVLDYYVPGLGTAINAGKTGLGNAVGKTDEDISEKDKANIAKIKSIGAAAGAATNTALGYAKKNKKDKPVDTTITTPSTNQSFEEMVDSDIASGTFDDKQSVQTSQQTQAIDYSQIDQSNWSPDQIMIFNNLKTNDEKAKFIKDNEMFFAEGGQIKGKGGPKSDSINAKLEGGGFVVPAENAEKAMAIREQYLADEGDSKAPLQSGDTPVKVSNGEHYFTAQETEYLRSQGVDLDALAPNAKEGNKKADGGGIDLDAILKEISKQKKAEKQRQEEIRKKNEAKIKAEKDAKIKEELIVKAREESNTAKQRELALEYKENQIKKKFNEYKTTKSPVGGTSTSFNDTKEKQLNKLQELISDYQETRKKYYPNESSNLGSPKSSTENAGPSAYDETKFDKTIPNKNKPGSGLEDQIKKNDGATSSGTGVGTGKGSAGSGIRKTVGQTAQLTNDPTKGMTLEEKKAWNLLNAVEPMKMKTGESENKAPEEMALKPVDSTTPDKAKNLEKKKAFDPTAPFAAYQFGEGVRQLLMDGKRPVDTLPADYVTTVQKAKIDAMYGIDPMERSIAEKNIERNRRADIANIVSLSGGNAGAALGNIRAASMGANEATNNLSVMSEKLRLEKQRYYDSLVQDKANKSRQLFEDKLNAFNINQQAGATLVGSGIRNLVGAQRYQTELAAQEEANKLGKYTFNV